MGSRVHSVQLPVRPSSQLLAVTTRAAAFTASDACPMAMPQPAACNICMSLLVIANSHDLLQRYMQLLG